MSLVTGLATLLGAVPVDPDAPDAQQWLRDELAKPEYQSAKPTWFDQLAATIRDWITSLQFGSAEGPPALGMLVIVILIAVGIVVALLIFGLPRLNRRSAVAGALFGEDDNRSAADMRRAAEQAANRGDLSLAITEMFRAIARGLAERTVLTVTPGTTAHDFARRAGLAFPELADRVTAAATAFDEVRYLGRDGTREQFEQASALETDLRAARPVLEAEPS